MSNLAEMTRAYRNGSARQWRAANPEKVFAIDLWRRYKITLETYYEILKKQRGRCAICRSKSHPRGNTKNKFRVLHVDHNHKTGRVRGLLCYTCNNGLGCFKDNHKLLKNAQLYLKRK